MKKILSVDDEPQVLTCLKNILKREGYEIFITCDPEEGLKILQEEDIALVMLDVKMPKKNGFDLYRELRQHRDIPVLFVTAYSKSFTAESSQIVDLWQNEFAEGTTDIIYKPFELDKLIQKVEGLIGKSNEEGDHEPTG